MNESPDSQNKLQEIRRNRVRMSLVLIMIIEHKSVYIDELVKMTGYDFVTVNNMARDLARLNLISISPTNSLPLFRIKNQDDGREYLDFLQNNFHLEDR